MDCYADYARKLRIDVENASYKLGPNSTRQLLDLLYTMAVELDCLNKEMRMKVDKQ